MAKKVRTAKPIPKLEFQAFFFADGARFRCQGFRCIQYPEIEMRVHIPRQKKLGPIFVQAFIEGDSTDYVTPRRAYHALMKRKKKRVRKNK